MMSLATAILEAALAVQGQPPPQAGITIDKDKKEVLVPCRIAPRKMPYLSEIYPIEVVATWPHPKGQKAHETVVNFDVKPSDVHKALEGLGLKAGKPARGEDGVASGDEVEIFLELAGKGGAKKRIPLESVLIDRKTAKPFPPLHWKFTGSSMKQLDPSKPDLTYAGDLTGTLIGIYPVTDELVVQTQLTMHEEGAIKIEIVKGSLPPEGTPATLVIRPAGPRAPVVAAPALTPRAAAEAEVFGFTERIALSGARPAPLSLRAPVAPPYADPFAHRRDLSPAPATVEEARLVPQPLPPLPRPATK